MTAEKVVSETSLKSVPPPLPAAEAPELRFWKREVPLAAVAGLFMAVVLVAIVLSMGLAHQILRSEASIVSTTMREGLKGVAAEVHQLNQSVSYSTEEEIIFLKILYMHQGSPPIKIKQARQIATAVHTNCQRFKRDPDFVLAIMASESNFNPKAVSNMGAIGLMQVMPQWNDILRLEGDLNDINTNIHHGLLVYGFYENMYKDVNLALSAYNRGPGKVDSDLMRGKNPARNGYADGVLRHYNKLKKLSDS